MRYVLFWFLSAWLGLLLVDGWSAFKIFSPRAWRKFFWKLKRDWKLLQRRDRWRRVLKKTSAVPRGISPR